MRDTNGQHVRFAGFELDPANELLRKGGVVVQLAPQPFRVLTMFAGRPGQLVTREELYRAIWGNETVVDFERGLNTCMRQIRTALGEEAGNPQYIETVPRRGYRFIAPVEEITPVPVEPKPPVLNATPEVAAPMRRAPFARKYVLGSAVVLLIALATSIPATLLLHDKNAAALSTRSSILIDPASMASMWDLSLSPNGKWLTFIAPRSHAPGAVPVLWVRPLNSLTARPIAGASRAFWSPDSRYIAFWDARTLKIVESSGGYPVAICDFGDDRGGTWSRYDVILFAGLNPGPIYRIPAKGGTPEAVTRIDESRGEIGHRWPFFLPDGHHFLYSARLSVDRTRDEVNTIRVASLDGRTNEFLLYADSNATYAQGNLLFVRDHRLMAQPFDAATLSTTRDAVAIADPIVMVADHGDFYASASGALVYRTGADFGSRLVWLDRNGKQFGSLANTSRYYRPRIAPDGRTIAVDAINDGKVNRDLWIYPVSGGTGTRLTSSQWIHTHPIWSPDGRRIVFAASASTHNERDLLVRTADPDAHDEPLLNTPGDKTPSDWSADGRFIAYQLRGPKRSSLSLWVLPLFGSRKPFEFHPSAFESKDGQFSPNGRWIAYTSNESGSEEVYLAAFPEGGNSRKVSVRGGSQPRWRRDGRELFYLSADDKLMAADVQEHGTTLHVQNVHRLFDCLPARVPIGSVYDVSGDGQRFLVSTPANAPSPPPILITNWTATLPH